MHEHVRRGDEELAQASRRGSLTKWTQQGSCYNGAVLGWTRKPTGEVWRRRGLRGARLVSSGVCVSIKA